MTEKTQLTKEGYKKLEDELRNLIDFVREDVKKQLAEARAQGDLSELDNDITYSLEYKEINSEARNYFSVTCAECNHYENAWRKEDWLR